MRVGATELGPWVPDYVAGHDLADILPIDPILHRRCCFRQREMPILNGVSSAVAQLVARSIIGGFLNAAGQDVTGCRKCLNLLKFASIFQRPETVNESTDRLCPRFDR